MTATSTSRDRSTTSDRGDTPDPGDRLSQAAITPPPRPLSNPGDELAAAAWADRLRSTVADLAADQRRLDHQVQDLFGVVEDLQDQLDAALERSGGRDADDRPRRAKTRVAEDEPDLDLALRILRFVAVRPLRWVRRMWREAGDAPTVEVTVDPGRAPRRLRLGRLTLAGAHAEDPDTERGTTAASSPDGITNPRAAAEHLRWCVDPARIEVLGTDGEVLESLPGGDADAVRAAARSDVVLVVLDGPTPSLPVDGIARLALVTLAAEDLRFVHVRLAGTGRVPTDLLLVRWSWWHPDRGLDPRRIASARTDRPLGRSVFLDSDASRGVPALTSLGMWRTGSWWLPRRTRGTVEHPVAAHWTWLDETTPGPEEPLPPLAILLGRPLDAGLWALATSILDHHRSSGRRVLVLGLVPDDGEGPHSLVQFARRHPWVLPVADLVAHPDLLASRVAQILGQHGIRHVVHLGPGHGIFTPELEPLWHQVQLADLPLPAFPPRPLDGRRPDGRIRCTVPHLDSDPGSSGLGATSASVADAGGRPAGPASPPIQVIPLPWERETVPRTETPPAPSADVDRCRARARARLDLPQDAAVVAWVGDLTAGERPEDVPACARSIAEARAQRDRERADQGTSPPLVMAVAGTGPLRSTVSDLVRWYALGDRWRWVDPSDSRDLLLASDLVCVTAEDPAVLYLRRPVERALLAGRPVVAYDLARHAELLLPAEGDACGTVVPLGDVEGLAAAAVRILRVRHLPAHARRAASRGQQLRSGPLAPAAADTWLSTLDLALFG